MTPHPGRHYIQTTESLPWRPQYHSLESQHLEVFVAASHDSLYIIFHQVGEALSSGCFNTNLLSADYPSHIAALSPVGFI